MKWMNVGTTGWMLAAVALAACGGGAGGTGGTGGAGAGKACSSSAQCGSGEECVSSTAKAASASPMDFEDEDGFGGAESFGGTGGGDGFGGSGGEGAGGTDPGSGGSGHPSGTCQPTGGSGGSGNVTGSGGSTSGGSGGGSSCSSDFVTGSTFYKGDVAFGPCDDPAHPKNCQFGIFLLTIDGCVCTVPCNTSGLPSLGEACSTDGSWVCQTLQNADGAHDLCTHAELNLCTAG
jgi:hypothetical protein